MGGKEITVRKKKKENLISDDGKLFDNNEEAKKHEMRFKVTSLNKRK